MWSSEKTEATWQICAGYEVDRHRQYLDKIPQVAPSCLEVETAHERHSVLPRSVQLQLIGLAHISVVRAVAG
jgi:hypothetical protein